MLHHISAGDMEDQVARWIEGETLGAREGDSDSAGIGARLNGRSVPFTRTYGGRPAFKCKSLPSSFTKALNSLSISSSLRFPKKRSVPDLK